MIKENKLDTLTKYIQEMESKYIKLSKTKKNKDFSKAVNAILTATNCNYFN